jgi:hypothetical protein
MTSFIKEHKNKKTEIIGGTIGTAVVLPAEE